LRLMQPYPRALLSFILAICLPARAGSRNDRANLFPQLQAGATIFYEVSYASDRKVKTESAVAAPMAPNGARVNAHGLLRVEVLDVAAPDGRPLMHLRTQFETLNSDTHLRMPNEKPGQSQVVLLDPQGKFVEFTLLPDGRIDTVKGLDALFPEQQQLWSEWVARFAATAVFPKGGPKRGDKWETEEPETSPAPIAGLVWVHRATYVRDEPCRTMMLTVAGDIVQSNQPAETCAVILTTATLKQKSSPKDATPEEYKLHDLRTMGTARGTNEIISYVSLKSGLMVRATEEARQSMDLIVAKADSSNRVHYNVDAESHGSVFLVSETPLQPPQPSK